MINEGVIEKIQQSIVVFGTSCSFYCPFLAKDTCRLFRDKKLRVEYDKLKVCAECKEFLEVENV